MAGNPEIPAVDDNNDDVADVQFPDRPGITWEVGARLEAQDTTHKWYRAKIIDIIKKDCLTLVHFDGWNSRWDEWFPMTSERIRACSKIPDYRERMRDKKSPFKVNERVLARWNGMCLYPARITGIDRNGHFKVLFYDGVVKTLATSNIKHATDDELAAIEKELNERQWLVPQVAEGRRARKPTIPDDDFFVTEPLFRRRSTERRTSTESQSSVSARRLSIDVPGISASSSTVASTGTSASTSTSASTGISDSAGTSSRDGAGIPDATITTSTIATHSESSVVSPEGKKRKKTSGPKSGPKGSPGSTLRKIKRNKKYLKRGQAIPDDILTSPTTFPKIKLGGHHKSTKIAAEVSSLSSTPSRTIEESYASFKETIRKRRKSGLSGSGGAVDAVIGGTISQSQADVSSHTVITAYNETAAQPQAVSVTALANTAAGVATGISSAPGKTPRKTKVKKSASVYDRMARAREACHKWRKDKETAKELQKRDLASHTSSIADDSHIPATPTRPTATMTTSTPLATNTDASPTSPTFEPLSGDVSLATPLVSPISDPKISMSKPLAPKALVIDDDHNQYKCPHCVKGFRKENLLNYHLKYYHAEEGPPPTPPTPIVPDLDERKHRTADDNQTKSKKRAKDSLKDFVYEDIVPKKRARKDSCSSESPKIRAASEESPRRLPKTAQTRRLKSTNALSSETDYSPGAHQSSLVAHHYNPLLSTSHSSSKWSKRTETSSDSTEKLPETTPIKQERMETIGEDEIHMLTDPDSGMRMERARLDSMSAESVDVMTEDLDNSASTVVIETAVKPGVAQREEVINCICRLVEENGLMIQCEVCLCWQHVVCLRLPEDKLPQKYICWMCSNPPGLRDSCRFMHDQDWLKEGQLTRFSYLDSSIETERRSPVLKAAASLVGDVHNISDVLHSTKLKIQLASQEQNPALTKWWNIERSGVSDDMLTVSRTEAQDKHQRNIDQFPGRHLDQSGHSTDTPPTHTDTIAVSESRANQDGCVRFAPEVVSGETSCADDEMVITDSNGLDHDVGCGNSGTYGLDTSTAVRSSADTEGTVDVMGEVGEDRILSLPDAALVMDSIQLLAMDGVPHNIPPPVPHNIPSPVPPNLTTPAPLDDGNLHFGRETLSKADVDLPNQGVFEGNSGAGSSGDLDTSTNESASVYTDHSYLQSNQKPNVLAYTHSLTPTQVRLEGNSVWTPVSRVSWRGNRSGRGGTGPQRHTAAPHVTNPAAQARHNLLTNIISQQDLIDQRLDLLEQQIKNLEEIDEGHQLEDDVDPLADLPDVKRSLRTLIHDLCKVRRMSTYSTTRRH